MFRWDCNGKWSLVCFSPPYSYIPINSGTSLWPWFVLSDFLQGNNVRGLRMSREAEWGRCLGVATFFADPLLASESLVKSTLHFEHGKKHKFRQSLASAFRRINFANIDLLWLALQRFYGFNQRNILCCRYIVLKVSFIKETLITASFMLFVCVLRQVPVFERSRMFW